MADEKARSKPRAKSPAAAGGPPARAGAPAPAGEAGADLRGIAATLKGPPFLMWYDDNPKVPIDAKISAAIAAYTSRFRGVKPTLVLVNEAEVTQHAGVLIRGVSTVRRNTYWVGQES